MVAFPEGVNIGFPFVRYQDGSLTDEASRSPFHVLGHSWAGASPVLALRPLREEGGPLFYEGEVLELELSSFGRIDMRAGREVFCTGRWEGEHVPCPGREPYEGFSRCRECMAPEIPDPSCVFEPHCHMGTCGAFFCQAEHVVYLAMFGRRMKVGLTQASRVIERGMEQGADLMMVLARTQDRYSARALENLISRRYRISQFSSDAVLKGLERPTPIAEVKNLALAFFERVRREQIAISDLFPSRGTSVAALPRDLPSEPLIMGPYPIPERLEAAPRRIPPEIVRGEVVGFKGKWGVIRSNGSLAAFKTGDLVGRIAYMDPSSLGND